MPGEVKLGCGRDGCKHGIYETYYERVIIVAACLLVLGIAALDACLLIWIYKMVKA